MTIIESITTTNHNGDVEFRVSKSKGVKVYEKWFNTDLGLIGLFVYRNEKGFRRAIKRLKI